MAFNSRFTSACCKSASSTRTCNPSGTGASSTRTEWARAVGATSRAIAAKDFLVQLGVPADRLRTLSYGKERPQCTDNNEACWQKNRRAHFTGQ